ncbi:MAG: glycosyltransferase family 2 protein, partial [Sideroxydans sp.]
MKKRICFVLACHNRRSATLKCLESVFQQESDDSVEIEAVLLDDASTDGTATSVMEYFPKVVVLHGSGSLYWNGGMHRALGVAKERNFDYYVLLNDDTVLYSFALKALLSTHEKLVLGGHGSVVVIGSTQDSRSGQLTYGGRRSTSNWNPLKMEKIEPLDEPVMSHTMNGNCVLIPRAVVDKVGNLDGHFTHSMGDMDYGFRVRKLGGKLWVAPGF